MLVFIQVCVIENSVALHKLYKHNTKSNPPAPNDAGGFCIFILNYVKTLCLLLLHLCKAFAAINRTVVTGLERHSCFAAAGRAGRREHFSFPSRSVLSCIAASFASLGLVYKPFFSIELLLAGSESKFFPALFADDGLVFVHFGYLQS